MFAALSENMDFFRDKLNLFIALAPVVKVDNCTSTIIKMKDNDMIDKITNKFQINEIFPSKGKNRNGAAFFHKVLPEISNLGIKLLCDDDPKEVN